MVGEKGRFMNLDSFWGVLRPVGLSAGWCACWCVGVCGRGRDELKGVSMH